MKRNELQKCSFCGKGMLHDRHPMFNVVTVDRYFVKPDAIQRRHGLEEFFGGGSAGAMLAGVMGTDENLAEQVGESLTLFFCNKCSLERDLCVAALAELEPKPA